MCKPIRIQRQRTKGWKMPPNTLSVTRPGPWGNPFIAGQLFTERAIIGMLGYDLRMSSLGEGLYVRDAAHAVLLYEKLLTVVRPQYSQLAHLDPEQLRGYNLACWCGPGQPCHADVLLRLANAPTQAQELATLVSCLERQRFTLEKEKDLQRQIGERLRLSGIAFKAEVFLNLTSIIDFMVGSIGVEVKLGGRPKAIFLQCERYAQFPEVQQLLVVTNKILGLPSTINGKPVTVLNLGRAWL